MYSQPYAKRSVPPPSDDLRAWANKFVGWLNIEFGNVQRGMSPAVSRTVTSSVTAMERDGLILVDATAGNVSVTLLDPAAAHDTVTTIKRVDASVNTVTIVGTVDGVVNPTLAAQWDSITVWAHVPTGGVGAWYTVATV